jgi:hypothetical protein
VAGPKRWAALYFWHPGGVRLYSSPGCSAVASPGVIDSRFGFPPSEGGGSMSTGASISTL